METLFIDLTNNVTEDCISLVEVSKGNTPPSEPITEPVVSARGVVTFPEIPSVDDDGLVIFQNTPVLDETGVLTF